VKIGGEEWKKPRENTPPSFLKEKAGTTRADTRNEEED